MHEMVLNHTSLRHPDRHTAVEWLTGMAAGILELHKNGVVEPTLSMSQMPGWPLFDVCQALPQDKCVFIMELFDKSRLLSGVDEDTKGCEVVGGEGEAQMLSPQDSVPLIFCANTNAIAVGFPYGIWDCDQITVNGEAAKTIDNLTRCAHARTIYERHRAGLPQPQNGAELWEIREKRFPNLKFGRDVERNLTVLGGAALQTAVNRLESLSALAAAWRNDGGPSPSQWDGVRDESKSVKNTPRLSDKRLFRSQDGTRQLFYLHTDFRGGKRIHLRSDPSKREVEIGYIGPHLPIRTA